MDIDAYFWGALTGAACAMLLAWMAFSLYTAGQVDLARLGTPDFLGGEPYYIVSEVEYEWMRVKREGARQSIEDARRYRALRASMSLGGAPESVDRYADEQVERLKISHPELL